MNKHFTNLTNVFAMKKEQNPKGALLRGLFFISMLLMALSSHAQISYSEGFNGCTSNPCNNWSWDLPSGNMSSVSSLGYQPCDLTSNPAAYVGVDGSQSTAILSPTASLGTSSGEFVEFGFSYKVLEFSLINASIAAAASSVTFDIDTASSPVGPWAPFETFQNVSSTSCVPFETDKFFPASGSDIYVRIRATRNSGTLWVVIDDITLNQPAPSVVESTDCTCNNDQTLNMMDGTYSTALTIRYSDNAPMEPGLSYTLRSSTGLSNTSGGPIGTPSFVQCNGGCPPGVTMGEYYLPVQVQPGGMYSAMVDGPDPGNEADYTLASTTCSDLYPALPTIPFNAQNCLDLGLNVFNTDVDVVFSTSSDPSNPNLPDGFTQTGPRQLTIDNEVYDEVDNEPDGIDLYLISTDAGSGCTVSSFINMEVYNAISPDLINLSYDCRMFRANDTLFLTNMLDSLASGDGNFYVDGNLVPDGKLGVSQDDCFEVVYEVMDVCGTTLRDTKNLLLTYAPEASFDFRSNPGDPVSPQCSREDIDVELVRNSTSTSFSWTVSSNNPSYSASLTGNTVSLETPGVSESVSYEICLIENGNTPPTCPGTNATTCSDTLCKTFVVFRDKSDCGADALFTSTCEIYQPELCVTDPTPGLAIGCSFFEFETPELLLIDLDLETPVAECTLDSISGSFDINLLGISGSSLGGGRKIESFDGINVVCSVLNFKILGWRPLGKIYNLLGCDKTIAQFIFGAISDLAGGDGGGGTVMADTDGDGAFDYLIEDSTGKFPVDGNFTIPNNLDGPGQITVRAVGGWINSPTQMCGDLGVQGVNVLDLLPIGAIPIVGAIIEDVLATFQCNVNIAISNAKDAQVLVGNNEVPTFQNCNPEGYTFAQTLECDLPVNWSIPVAFDGCNVEEIVYVGITDNVDVSNYPGTPPATVMEDMGPGIYQTSGPAIGSVLTPGVYPVTYQAVSCNGLPETCTFNVTVTSGDPVLEAPNDITISTTQDLCTAEANGLAPYQGIGCSSIINYRYTNPVSMTTVETNSTMQGEHNIPDGQVFELGVTNIIYTMEVDINGDGDFADANETQVDTFSITVVDQERPEAICIEVDIQLDNTGAATVFARERTNAVYIDAGSTDNCGIDSILISKDNVTFLDSLVFDCSEKGNNVINMKVVDVNGNISYCKSVVNVIDFFEGYRLDLDLPETCFEPFQDTIDFSPYITIAQPTGNNISHQNVSTIGPEVFGVFGISSFLPDPGSTNDPGTITTDGVYTIGTGTGWITISYILAIEEQVNQLNDTTDLTGCFRMVHDVFRVEKLDPVWNGGFVCCDQAPIFLGGAFWDGNGAPSLPAGLISLEDIRGSYPGDVQGEWTGDGVSFVDPDGIDFSGDEYFQFDPSGFDQSVTLTYTIGDEPCIFDYSQEILVTCQDLQIALSDTTVCPATIIPERVVITNLDDDDIVVSTTGLAAVGGRDLVEEPVVDGRVVIPGFTSVAVRNETFTIGVSVFQTTDFGCADFFSYDITVLDTLAPVFQNCPREPYIVEALPDLCGNFVNFEYPWADDNCFSLYTVIEQVDTTNLVSGDWYPVGTTILAYTATDTVGNQSYCEVKIVVNDYEQDPSITCPADVMAVNDPGQCSAVINDLPPADFSDNCPNNTITYEVTDENGEVLYCGFEDASGNIFPVGTTTVSYEVSDQSLLLITEIVQDGNSSGIEITNFGPSEMDITCAQVAVFDGAGMQIDSFLIPTSNNKSTEIRQVDFPPLPTIWDPAMPNVLSVGETWTYTFNNTLPAGAEARYQFKFLDRIIDDITVNDEVEALVFLRETVCDHDEQTDFIPATPCDPGSFGMLNPGLPTMTDNGMTSSLQAFDANIDTCSFNVVVTDIEAPVCIMHDSVQVNSNITTPIDLGMMTCGTSIINIPDGGVVNDVNVYNLLINTDNAADLTVYLNSPSGTRILLFEGLCEGTMDVDVNLDETENLQITPSITSAPCGPLGQGGFYSPQESFKAFFGEPSNGDWELEMYTSNTNTAQIVDWDLEILREEPYAQGDTLLENDEMLCSAEFTWVHPVFRDNCCDGSMVVSYTFTNDVTGDSTYEEEVLQSIDGSINNDGTTITRVFPVGETVVTYTLVDQYGLESTCGFVVTVQDTEDPTFPISCPDWTLQLGGGECYAQLPFVPSVDDNCEVDSIAFCDPNGDPVDISRIPIGMNEITMKAIDIYGNVGTCVFIVDVLEYVPASDNLTCNGNLNISLGPDCTAEIFPDMILEGNEYRCYENYCMSVEDEFGFPHSTVFTANDIGKTFSVTITDCLGSNNSCWGFVTIEEKLIPEIACPRDTFLFCNEDADLRDNAGRLLTGELELLSCEPGIVITYEDHLDNGGLCGNPRAVLTRRWRAEDVDGNVVFCDQIIRFEEFTFADVEFPADFNRQEALSCHDVLRDPRLTTPDSTGRPTINGNPIFGTHYCDVNVGYNDIILQDANCGAGYEILRYWTIRNECQPLVDGLNPMVHIQSIKVDDISAPKLYPVSDVTVSTQPWDCRGRYALPDIVKVDDCSDYEIKWSVSYGQVIDDTLYNLLEGETQVRATVTDACGNSATRSFTVTVRDLTAPVAITKQDIVVTLSNGGINNEASAKLFVEGVNQFSYDNCSEVKVEIRRMGAPECENTGNNTFDNTGHTDDSPTDSDDGAYVKFCCEDLTTSTADVDGDGVMDTAYHTVVMRTWDDANGTGIFGDTLANGYADNYNEIWAYVKVEDNVPPTIACPDDATISCFWAIDVSTDFGAGFQDASQADFEKTGMAVAYSSCQVENVEFSDRLNLDDCGVGTIRRTWRVTKDSKNGPQTAQCIQNITVEAAQSVFEVTPPNGQPFANAECEFDVNNIAANQKPSVVGGICDVIGESITVDTFLFEGGVCKKWVVSYSYYNWCTGEDLGPIEVTYVYEDTEAPVIACEDACYSTDANCEYTLSLSKSAVDTSGCTSEGWLKWHVTVDTWADGNIDYVISTYAVDPANGRRITQWATNEALSANFNVPPTTQWIYVDATASGQAFNSTAIPEDLGGKYSEHKVVYKVTDGCHNFSSCQETIEVVDKKAPTPYCVSLSTALMADPDGDGPAEPMVELWACDFNQGSFDNCTASEDLMYTFDNIPFAVDTLIRQGQIFIPVNVEVPHYFNENGFVDFNGDGGLYPLVKASTVAAYNRGELQKWIPETRCAGKVFTCDDAPQTDIVMSVWDKNLNVDFCNVFLTFGGEVGACDPANNRVVAGHIQTELGSGVEAVEVAIEGLGLERRIDMTDENGDYRFGGVIKTVDAMVRPIKDGDDDNGISTLDLVMIQRHILTLAPLNSVYKVIAADVNNTASITGADVVELRKLVLGVQSEFANNNSWRFVDAGESMLLGEEFPFKEMVQAEASDLDQMEVDFVAVKIGDLNNSAEVLEGRSSRNIEFQVTDRAVSEGELLEIPVTSSNYKDLFGYQFTMKVNGLELIDVQSVDLGMSVENMAVLDEETITVSYASGTAEEAEHLFTLVMRATSSGSLLDMLRINSEVTSAESYVMNKEDIEVGSISLVDNRSTVNYALYQNEPNPFKDQTVIGWDMAEAGEATLSIYDVQGKVIYQLTGEYSKGEHMINLNRSDLPGTSGVLYYQLECEGFTATKKMILID
jgi:subtilisin-like proprotein convertase family protein